MTVAAVAKIRPSARQLPDGVRSRHVARLCANTGDATCHSWLECACAEPVKVSRYCGIPALPRDVANATGYSPSYKQK